MPTFHTEYHASCLSHQFDGTKVQFKIIGTLEKLDLAIDSRGIRQGEGSKEVTGQSCYEQDPIRLGIIIAEKTDYQEQ